MNKLGNQSVLPVPSSINHVVLFFFMVFRMFPQTRFLFCLLFMASVVVLLNLGFDGGNRADNEKQLLFTGNWLPEKLRKYLSM